MKTLSLLPSLSLFVLLNSAVTVSADNAAPASAPAAASSAAKPILYQVSKVKGADVQIQEDAQALGGEYVMNHQAYNPVLFLATPPGDSLTIWARVRGSSFQLKGVVGGNQQPLDWVWGTAGQFTWKKFGTYARTQLGDQLVIIRGDKADATDGIDAVLISPDPNFSPDSAANLKQYLAP